MGVGQFIKDKLDAGGTNTLVKGNYVGDLSRRPLYPCTQIRSFSTSTLCKGGEASEDYTVTVIAWDAKQDRADDIVEYIKQDLTFADGIYFQGRGPFVRKTGSKYYGRPAEFKVRIDPSEVTLTSLAGIDLGTTGGDSWGGL